MQGLSCFGFCIRTFISSGALLASICIVSEARADNPFVTTSYGADPSARLFQGKLWIYPSHDRADAREFDMADYHAYSTVDLQNWQDHGVIFSLKDVSWAKGRLWAPDCGFKDGTYYLYFPADSDGAFNFKLGVATSKSPGGPFVDSGKPIAGTAGTDPAFFMDDDGQAYLIWSSGGPTICKLKPNLTELDGTPTCLKGCDNFYEGPWIFKRQSTYYLTYPAFKPNGAGRGGRGQNFDYATAPAVMGPYTYQGSFSASGPGGDNIHGSQIEFGGEWLCLYHDFSASSGYPNQQWKRNLKMDVMQFDAHGGILPLKMTSRGPAQLQPADPYKQWPAACLCQTDVPEGPHAITVNSCREGGESVGPLKSGDWIRYAGFDFGKEAAAGFTVRAASAIGTGSLALHLDDKNGPLIGACDLRYTGDWQSWQTFTCKLTPNGARGVHDLYFVCTAPNANPQFSLSWFQFSR